MFTRRSALASLFALPLTPIALAERTLPWHTRLIAAARAQIGVTRLYDPAYVSLAYPGGDVPSDRGVCTDVIIRAYRDAFDMDLQQLVHEDMRANFAAYPTIWGLTRPDKNIDHRRVPNLETYMSRAGAGTTRSRGGGFSWAAGDLYTMRLGGRLPHIAVVSDRTGPRGYPLVIHNIGAGTREEDLIGLHESEQRFRLAPPNPA